MRNSHAQNDYYSMAEQKMKLLTTVTLNETQEFNMNLFDTKDMLTQSKIENNSGGEEDNTIEGQSEDGFKMKMAPYKSPNASPRNPIEELKESNRLNDSHLGPHDNLNKSDLQVRGLRAGSFKSLQGFEDESYDEGVFLNHPREKVDFMPFQRPDDQPQYQGKLS